MTHNLRRMVTAVLVCASAWFVTTSGQQRVERQAGYVPDELLVQFRTDVVPARRDALVAARGGRVVRRLDDVHVDRVQVPPGTALQSMIAAFRNDPEVVSVQPNFIREVVAVPNDPYWANGSLWGLEKIQAQQAWSVASGSPSVIVANFDTGVNYNHPDLAANMWRNPGETAANGIDDDRNGYVDDVYGIDTANNDSNPMDDHGHGTHTAGTAGAVGNNGTGVAGVNWNTRILACKFIKADGTGSDGDAIECFNYVIALKKRGVNVRVTSNSWGSARDPNASFPQSLKSAIDAAGTQGILNVFAAGNSGANIDVTPFDPASFTSPSIVSVAASDQNDQRAGFSNYGATAVDIAAPGVGIVSTGTSGYVSMSGTSMAAPHVAGAAALLSGYNSTLTADGVKTLLLDNTDDLSQWNGVVASAGRLNLFSALLTGSGDVPPSVSLSSPAAGSTFIAPASITLSAVATDADGTVAKVEFFANGTLVGTDTSSPYSVTWSATSAGSYSITAVATDDRTFTGSSASVAITVTAPTTSPTARVNVASAANGGRATASSSYSSATAQPASAIDGNRTGTGYSFWSDAGGTFPDWLRVDFAAARTIDEVDVFSVQDNFTAPSTPTTAMTFNNYGLTNFSIEYWTGTGWAAIPGATATGNRNVWRQFTFTPITTTAIRVYITATADGWSRVVEVEAYTGDATAPPPPPSAGRINVALTSNGAIGTASSTYGSTTNQPASALNGDKTGAAGMFWSDTGGTFPDWLRVDFAGSKTINEVDVFSVQDNYTAPIEPTSTLLFSRYGVTNFQLEYWTGTAWAVIPGATVTGNRNVWRQFTFTPITTTAIRVFITATSDGWSRLVELEAYAADSTAPPPPPPPSTDRINVALTSNGAIGTASSTYGSTANQPASALNGDRTGAAGKFWSDTGGAFPDWLRVDFAGSKTIDEVDVFSVQDNYTSPIEPTSTLLFSRYGLTNFQMEYWTGTAWAPLPGATAIGNRNVWRKFTFTPVTTTAIRILITGTIDGWSRVTEIEVYGTGTSSAPSTALIGFPSDNWWHLDISNAPVDPKSASYISFIGSTRGLHPDFGGPYGMPYIVTDDATPKVAVQFGYSTESDGVDHTTNVSFPFYPIPAQAITERFMIEGVEPGNVDLRSVNDRHLLIVNKDKRHLYELWNVFYDGARWHAGSGAFFDMNTNNRRTEGWTSADAAGLAILPGLIRYDEMFGSEEIRHAFRVTVRATNGYVYPASHRAGSTAGALPMGARLRLKANKNLSGFSPELQRVFRAMQRYGLIVADNGQDMFISGAYDPRWNNDVLNPAFKLLTANDFEVISLGYR